MKKVAIIIISVLVTILIINFVYSAIILNDCKYNLVIDDSKNYNLFNPENRNKISFKQALGNDSEQLFFYKYEKNLDLIVWRIKGYSNVDLSDIHMYLIENFNDIFINPNRSFEMERFEISSKTDTLLAKRLLLYTGIHAEIINHFENDTSSYVSLLSKGFIVAEENNPQIKISGNKQMIFNVFMKKEDDSICLIFLAFDSNNVLNYDRNLLLNLLK